MKMLYKFSKIPTLLKKMSKKILFSKFISIENLFPLFCLFCFLIVFLGLALSLCSSSVILSRSIQCLYPRVAQLLVAVLFLGFGIKYQEIKTFSESFKTHLFVCLFVLISKVYIPLILQRWWDFPLVLILALTYKRFS